MQQTLDSLLKQMQETVRRLKALETRRSEPPTGEKPGPTKPAAAPAGPSVLTVGMKPEEVRAKLGEPVRTEDTPDFHYWHYGEGKYVYFDRTRGTVQGWLGL